MYQFRGWFCDIKDFKLHIKKKGIKRNYTRTIICHVSIGRKEHFFKCMRKYKEYDFIDLVTISLCAYSVLGLLESLQKLVSKTNEIPV